MDRLFLIAFLCLGVSLTNGQLFPSSHTFLFKYTAEVQNDLDSLDDDQIATLEFSSDILVETQDKLSRIRLKNISYNGQQEAYADNEIVMPFYIEHNPEGTLEAMYTDKTDALWSINVKKGIASLLQLDTSQIDPSIKNLQEFQSTESNVYGNNQVMNFVYPLNETHFNINKLDASSIGEGLSISNMKTTFYCQGEIKKRFSASAERGYMIHKAEQPGRYVIDEIKSEGEITSYANKKAKVKTILQTKQTLTKIDEKPTENQDFSVEDFTVMKNVKVQAFPDGKLMDITGRILEVDLEKVMMSVTKSLRRVVEEIQSDVLTPTNLPNTNIREMDKALQNMKFFDVEKMQNLYDLLSEGNTDVEKEMNDVFLTLLPFVGTPASSTLILKLVNSQSVTDRQAMKLLQDFPFHIKVYDIELLKSLEEMRDLKIDLNEDVRSSALLSFATLLSKTIAQQHRQSETLDLYVDYFINEFKEAKEYEIQMLFINCLRNIGTKKVAEFLEPLITGEESDVASVDYKLRSLALFATAEEYMKDTDAALSLYWSLLSNKSENLEMRSTALTLLMKMPLKVNLEKIITFMQDEEDQQLYNLFYSKLEVLSNTKRKCLQLPKLSPDYLKEVRKPISKKIQASQLSFNYFDNNTKYGESFQFYSVGDIWNNLFASEYFEMSEETDERVFNDYSYFVRENVPPQYLKEMLDYYEDRTTNYSAVYNLKMTEFMLMRNNKVFFSLYGKGTLKQVVIKLLIDPEKLNSDVQDFLLNYHTLNLDEEVYIPTELGTPAVIFSKTPSHFRINYKAQFPDTSFAMDSDVKVSTMNINGVGVYNPFSDIWHGSRKVRRTNLMIPIRFDTNFNMTRVNGLYHRNFDHKLTVNKDSKRFGVEVFGNTESFTLHRNDYECSDNCADHEIVNVTDSSGPYTEKKDLWSYTCPISGMTLKLTVFDCEREINLSDLMVKVQDFFSNENQNMHNILQVKYLLGLRGLTQHVQNSLNLEKCGLGFYVEPTEKKDKEYNINYYADYTDKRVPHYILDYSMKVESKEAYKALIDFTLLVKRAQEQAKIALTLSDAEENHYKLCLTEEIQRDINSYTSFLEYSAGEPASLLDVDCPKDDVKFVMKGSSVSKGTDDQLEDCEEKSRLRCLRDRTSLLNYKYDVQFANISDKYMAPLNFVVDQLARSKSSNQFVTSGAGGARIDVSYNMVDDSVGCVFTNDKQAIINNVTFDTKYFSSMDFLMPENSIIDEDIPSEPDVCEFDVDHINNVYLKDIQFSMPSNDWTTYGKDLYKDFWIKAKKLEDGNKFAMRFEIGNSTLEIFPTPTVGVFKITLNETEPIEQQNGVISKSSPFVFLVDGDRDHNVLVKLEGQKTVVDYNGTFANVFYGNHWSSGPCRFPPELL